MTQPSSTSKHAAVDFGYAQALGLTEDEWKKALELLGRSPNEAECQIIARLWSDDCSNKSGRVFLKTVFRDGLNIIRIPGRRIGAVEIGFGEAVTLKLDQNNQQCAADPFLGVQSGAQALLEDLITVGAHDLAVVDLLRVGHPENTGAQTALRASVSGLSQFCNLSGVPVVGGDSLLHERYNGAAIANLAAIGIVSTETLTSTSEVKPGNSILYVGAKTGRDNLVIDGKRQTKKADPYFSQLVCAFLRRAIESKQILEIQNIGVGGVAKALFDLSARIQLGLRCNIDQIPAEGAGMAMLDLLFGETCGRFLLVTSKERYRDISDTLTPAGISTILLGDILPGSDIEMLWQHHPAAMIPLKLASEESVEKVYQLVRFPPMPRKKELSAAEQVALQAKKEQESGGFVENPEDSWLDLLANPNLCSRRPIYRRCDQQLGTNTIVQAGSDAAVLRIKRRTDAAAARPERAIAVTIDSASIFCAADSYLGGVQTVAEAMRNLSASGAAPVACSQCLNFGDPADYKQISEFAEAVRGMSDACRAWDIPILSDSVSFRNTSITGAIMPTPSVVMLGIISDVSKAMTIAFRSKGDRVLLLGETKDELSASEYISYSAHKIDTSAPDINFALEKKTCDLVYELIHRGLLRSAHDLSTGGLASALAECCLSRPRPMGAELTLHAEGLRPEALLFSETSGRFLVSCAEKSLPTVRELCERAGVPITAEGTVGGRSIAVNGAFECAIPVATAYHIWSTGLNPILGIMD